MKLRQQTSAEYLEDDDIIELFFQRNEMAIRETDRKYRSYLYAIAYNFVHNASDSEECLNDTYHDVWLKIPPTRPSILKAFLAKITRRCAIDRFKTEHRGKRIPEGYVEALDDLAAILSDDSDPHRELESRELARLINQYLGTLSDHQVYIFVSRYYYAKPIKDIAKATERSVSYVNKELAVMKNGLKHLLESEGFSV